MDMFKPMAAAAAPAKGFGRGGGGQRGGGKGSSGPKSSPWGASPEEIERRKKRLH